MDFLLTKDYKYCFIIACILHIALIICLGLEHQTAHPVLEIAKNHGTDIEHDAIKAVSVSNVEVENTLQKLKQEKLAAQQAELKHQQQLQREAQLAIQKRLAEQKKVEQLKAEAHKMEILQQKKLQEQAEKLKQLALQKQQEEAKLLEAKRQAQKLKETAIAQAKEAAQAVKKPTKTPVQTDISKNIENAIDKNIANDNNSAMEGEINKYKALIIGAISRQWILPEDTNPNLSSEFRIRLAPNGAVLDVSLVRSSGNPILDRSAQAAIFKASPLPVPSDPRTFNLFRDIHLTVRPESVRG